MRKSAKRTGKTKRAKAAAPAKPTKKAGMTLIGMVLDESGSMLGIKSKTIEGFNSYLDKVKNDKKNRYSIRLTVFNDYLGIRTGDLTALANAPALTDNTYRPAGTTPLYDAIGKTIAAIEGDGHRGNTLIVILTDGLENSSKEYTKEGVKKLIEAKQKKGWNFIYLGANQDAWAEAARIGVLTGQTMTYDPKEITGTYAVAAAATIANASVTRGQMVNCSHTIPEAEWKKARKRFGKKD